MVDSTNRSREPSADARELATRLGAHALMLRLTDAYSLTAWVRRLHFSSPDLVDLTHRAGQDLMFRIPTGRGTVRRRYTIRRLDRAAGSVTVDVVAHGDGPGAQWAQTVGPGDEVEAVGPRGKVTVDGTARWHLFVGDESFTPAALAMAESLPAGARAVAVLEVDDPSGAVGDGADAYAELSWISRRADPDGLLEAVRAMPLPASGHAYVGGEHHRVDAIRAALVGRGMPPTAVSAKAYWRAGVANADHGEPHR